MTRVQLREVADIVGGGRHKLSGKQFVEAGGFPAYGAGGLNGFLDHREFCKSAVVLSSIGARCGKCFLTEPEWTSLANTQVIFPNLEKVDLKFLWYQLDDEGRWPRSGAAQPFIKPSDVKAHPIHLPPLDEQRRVVAVLDKAFAGIATATANAQKNLTNARALFDVYRNRIFETGGEGWSNRELGSVCDFLNGFAFKSSDAVTESNVQLIRMGNLYKNVLNLDRNPSFYPSQFANDFHRYELLNGDLIISLTGTVGKEDYGFVVEVPHSERTLLLNQRIAKLSKIDFSKVAKIYLLHLLRSRIFLDKLYAIARGTRQANLSTVTMKKLLLPFPSLDRQIELSEQFESLENQTNMLVQLYQRKLAALTELKQSLLQKAFAGELT